MKILTHKFPLPWLVILLLFGQSHGAAITSISPRPRATSVTRPSQRLNFTTPRYVANKNKSAIYRPIFAQHRNDTPRFINSTHRNVNPLLPAALGLSSLDKRAAAALPEGACAPGTPCVNGACCSSEGWCGYSPEFCGSGSCISNCDAKASCGQYAAEGKGACPLSVCCSTSGFCGTTEEFCGAGCDDTFGGCGQPKAPSCSSFANSIAGRRIGYYEGWAPTRPCDKRTPEDLQLDGLTHINFAFAFFNPTTFQMSGMDAETVKLYARFTALKSKKRGLQTWISIGGWSFNDETNVPNTRTAFSDMVSTQSNRAAFISSLKQFMATYNFDGVDLDWEYPGADDRGGSPADSTNLVLLLKEMTFSFGSRYGVTATLPSSFWYLQHFDLVGMQPYLDWFNIMSYDLHGTWDSTNVYSGPYVRPHTNLTEIDEALNLLWRVGISPSKVVLGMGWYGRSFTLSNSACNKPWCLFSGGGKAGACSGESGILSNAEILREISSRKLTPQIDTTAAVAWVSWNDQWVSYDNEATVRMKLQYANSRCLGGTMIWAIDLDDTLGTSLISADPNIKVLSSYQCGSPDPNSCPDRPTIGPSQLIEQTVGETACYTSFCNAGCAVGYTEVSAMNGLVGYVNFDNTCPRGQYQSLCCADGTTYTSCSWQGYTGLGMSCYGGCGDGVFSSITEVAQNTNRRDIDSETGQVVDQTCNGGYMSYCCEDFTPPPNFSQDFNLLGQDTDTKVVDLSDEQYPDREVAELASECPDISILVDANSATELDKSVLLYPDGIYKRSTGSLAALFYICYKVNTSTKKAKTIKGTAGPSKQSIKVGLGLAKPVSNKKKNTVGAAKPLGQWVRGAYTKKGSNDCEVTYTCQYGGYTTNSGVVKLFDQVCDNQRYYIENISPGGNNIFNMMVPPPGDYRPQVESWKNVHHSSYRANWQISNGIARCDMDEFPMNALQERFNPQALRALDRAENGAQGIDFKMWKSAVWTPCSSLRAANGIVPPEPPITWTWDGLGFNDPRGASTGIIRKYGFDSSSASLCFATFTKTGVQTVVTDHGFRVASTDPLFNPVGANALTWTNQWPQWRQNPALLPLTNVAAPQNRVAIAPWLKQRGISATDLEGRGLNDTILEQLSVQLEGTQLYLEDGDHELCHRLDLTLETGELPRFQENVNKICANALETDEPSPATMVSPARKTDTPSRNILTGLLATKSSSTPISASLMAITKVSQMTETTGLSKSS
ncbi:glycoside hydrolase family 18 protein [Cadophora sp. DSE1049]|nr:glycoside hydrolase family 18 protein [Cadophora sp. DSE1049]